MPDRRTTALIVACALALAGCLEADVRHCDDGIVCGADRVCSPLGGCVLPEQLAQCEDQPDATACEITGAAAACRGGVCLPIGCGDGAINGLEDCDGVELAAATCTSIGFYGGTLDCQASCRFDTTLCVGECGDDVRNGLTADAIEPCDGVDLAGLDCTDFGFYQPGGLGCTVACGFDTSLCTGGACGDGAIDDGETCEPDLALAADCLDFGFYQVGGLACHGGCGYDTGACQGFCGDGVVNGAEPCDGGPPAGLACLTEGWDAGQLSCGSSCQQAFERCRTIGFEQEFAGTANTFEAVWGVGDELFASGNLGAMVHTDGGAWSSRNTGLPATVTFYGVWGAAPDDVFAVGSTDSTGTTIYHHDGATWTRMPAPGAVILEGVWGAASDDVWAVGSSGTVLHYDGLAWTSVITGAPAGSYFVAVWGSGPDDVWIVGFSGIVLHWNGTAWTNQTLGGGLFAVWGTGPGDVYAVGLNGAIHHWNGVAWSPMTSCTAQPLLAVGGLPGGLIVAAGTDSNNRAVVCQLAGGVWFPIDVGPVAGIRGAWGTDSALVLVGGGNHLVSRGATWLPLLAPPVINARGIWASSPRNIVIVGASSGGDDLARHFNGTSWTSPTLPAGPGMLYDVWGASPTLVYAVGSAGQVRRFDGGASWVAVASGTVAELRAVWGSSATNVFAVGNNGTIIRYGGSSWAIQTSPTVQNLAGVWGSSASNVFAVGNAGTILRWNGSTWSAMTSGTSQDLSQVWGRSGSDVFAVGKAGAILHFDGTAWSPLPSGVTDDLHIVGGAGGDVLTAGAFGAPVLEYAGGRWTPMAVPATSFETRDITSVGDFTVLLLANIGGSVGVAALGGRIHHPAPAETACGDFWDDDDDGLADCADPECATAPSCAAPGFCDPVVEVACGQTVDGTTVGQPSRWPYYGSGCNPRLEPGSEAYYRVQRPTAGSIQVTLTGASTLDLIAAARASTGACIPDEQCLAASQTAGAEAVTIAAAAATDYVVIVDGTAAGGAPFTLQVACP